ncbi:hypothetical protein K5X82_12190 [Halosquirtibacter xylanolyticus]|uniref:hypothetical protein n=1 Tax=Halosquirtibacter xylanolyticus TaxID=3374599 RepID=UPI0037493C70|nr:hypothetical protein K5X82_12190 [Prolixibacteraceae bacterium]
MNRFFLLLIYLLPVISFSQEKIILWNSSNISVTEVTSDGKPSKYRWVITQNKPKSIIIKDDISVNKYITHSWEEPGDFAVAAQMINEKNCVTEQIHVDYRIIEPEWSIIQKRNLTQCSYITPAKYGSPLPAKMLASATVDFVQIDLRYNCIPKGGYNIEVTFNDGKNNEKKTYKYASKVDVLSEQNYSLKLYAKDFVKTWTNKSGSGKDITGNIVIKYTIKGKTKIAKPGAAISPFKVTISPKPKIKFD